MVLKKTYSSVVEIRLDGIILKGNLSVPENANSIVIFSHGSGSNRLSPRNRFVAEILQKNGLATLLFDLLTEGEDRIYNNRFNIDLLTIRLIDVTQWINDNQKTKGFKVGYFGASTGAASALRAAAFFGKDIGAVVSRGGRPDLAFGHLKEVESPTLLIVGGWDDMVIQLNEKVFQNLKCIKKLEIVPGATHLFKEEGKLEIVANISANWFRKWLY